MELAGQTIETFPVDTDPPTRALTTDEETDLRWYFEQGVDRLVSPSNMQAQLDEAEFFFYHAKPCRGCGGQSARVARDGTVLREERGGTGFVTSTKEWRSKAQLARLLGHKLELPGDVVCKKCDGKGWIKSQPSKGRKPEEERHQWLDGLVTAQRTGSSKDLVSPKDTGGDDNLRLLGRMDRMLALLRIISAESYGALEAFYSPSGRDQKLSALWHLTPSGKTMLRGNNMKLHPRQYFDNLSAAQAEKPDPTRRLQFENANRQADVILERARVAWVNLLDREMVRCAIISQ